MDKIINAKVEPGRVAIQWLGQGGFVFKAHAGDVIMVDPYLSDSANTDGRSPRMVDIPVKPREVHVDYLFLTHDHIDHTDLHTAPLIAQTNSDALVICPPSSVKLLTKCGVPSTQIQTAMAGQSIEFSHFTAHVVRAQHSEDSVGYVFEFNDEGSNADGPVVYITGDSEYWEGMADAVEAYGPDVLIVPINGKWGNMNAGDAAKLTIQVDPAEVIPMHYGMFANNTADPDQFVSLLASEAGPESMIRAVIMKHNSCHIYCPAEIIDGRHKAKMKRADRAKQAHKSHEHMDGVRGPAAPGARGRVH